MSENPHAQDDSQTVAGLFMKMAAEAIRNIKKVTVDFGNFKIELQAKDTPTEPPAK